MSQTTRSEWNPADSIVEPPREKNASMALLWVIALIAVAAAGLAWYKQRQSDTLPLDSSAPLVSTPAIETPAVDNGAAKTDARRDQANRDTQRRTTASVGTRLQAPRPLANNPSPKYPTAALRSGIGGTVMVRAEVDATGRAVDVDVVQRSGHRELDRAALSAVRQWRFEPATRNGRAVSSTVQVPVDFKPI